MNFEPGTDLGLTREQESCLKQQLLKLCVQDEVASFMAHPETIRDTLLMKFFKQKILEFPLWASNDKARAKIDEMIHKLPAFLTISQRATKHDMQNKKLRIFVVANFNSMLRTPQERRHDLRRTMEDYSPEQDIKEVEDPNEKVRQQTVVTLAREVARISLAIFLELEQQGGVDRFFAIVKAHKRLCDLPPLYQSFFKYMGKISAVQMERTYSDTAHVNSLKKLYALTPLKAIRGILAVTDPATLLDGLVSLFLMRPLGTYSLIQKIAVAGSELRSSKTKLGESKTAMMRALKSKMDAKKIQQILSALHSHASSVPLPIGEEEDFVGREVGHEIVDFDRLIPVQTVKDILQNENVLSLEDLNELSDTDIETIRNVLVLEMSLVLKNAYLLPAKLHKKYAVKDKSDFVELWGNQDTTSAIKELVPTLFGLMATLKKADVGIHLEKYFKAMKAIVKVSEQTKGEDILHRISSYEKLLDSLQQDLYAFIHSVFVADADNGCTLYKSFEWYVSILLHKIREALDVQQLLLPFSQEEREGIIAELDKVLEYYHTVEKTGKPPTSRPVVIETAKLKDSFLNMLRARLVPTVVVQQPDV